MRAMPIRNTGKLITDCWLRAEQSLREVVKKKFLIVTKKLSPNSFTRSWRPSSRQRAKREPLSAHFWKTSSRLFRMCGPMSCNRRLHAA